MKVKGFLKDVGGASRVTKARLAAFENASPAPVAEDPIGNVAREWHPGAMELVVDKIYPVSPTAKTVRFVPQTESTLFHQRQTAVIGADPEAVPAVHQ